MIKFETKFDEQVTKQLNSHTMKKMWWLYLLMLVVFSLLGAVSILGGDVGFGIFCIAMGVLFVPILKLFTSLLQRKINKSMWLLSEQTHATYQFDEEKFCVEVERGDDYYSKTVSKYNCLFKVNETATHYFLYISQQQSYVIAKETLVEGDLAQLNDIFARSLGEKYKPFKK